MNDFTWVEQDWIGLMIFKNFAITTGLDSISSNQNWTRTEKFHSPLISGDLVLNSRSFSVANPGVFLRLWACFSVKLRLFLVICGLLVFGIVFLKVACILGLFFADFCFLRIAFSNFMALLLF